MGCASCRFASVSLGLLFNLTGKPGQIFGNIKDEVGTGKGFGHLRTSSRKAL